jgi:hypothetical protein
MAMRLSRHALIVWAPRIVGIGLAVFLGIFAIDVFIENRGIVGTLVALAMHLIPAILVLALVWLGWRHEGIAGLSFAALAVFYAATSLEHPAWIVVIAGPLVLVSALFCYSWWVRTHHSPETDPSTSLPRS